MRYLGLTALCLSIFLTGACTLVSSVLHDDEVVARVGDSKIYKSELEKVIPDLISPEDSDRLAARYINSWAMDRLYSQVAERELSKTEIDVSQELEAYRLSLVKYRYEQRYIADRLDTLVTAEQIEEYYKAHQEDFSIKRPLLKVRFLDIMKDSPSRDRILKLMQADDYNELQQLDTLARTSALRYFDNSDTWMDAADLAREFGMDYQTMLSRMSNSMIKVEPEDRGDMIVAYVCDILRSGTAPIDYCSSSIRDIIISTRKHELVKGLEQDLLDNALESKQFVIY